MVCEIKLPRNFTKVANHNEVGNDILVNVSDDLRENYVNEMVQDESQEDDDEAEWEIEGDFERNAFDFIVDDEHN